MASRYLSPGADGARPKWAWPVVWVEAYEQALPPEFRAGIRYSRAVDILEPPPSLLRALSA
jgi:hypothetical protein